MNNTIKVLQSVGHGLKEVEVLLNFFSTTIENAANKGERCVTLEGKKYWNIPLQEVGAEVVDRLESLGYSVEMKEVEEEEYTCFGASLVKCYQLVISW